MSHFALTCDPDSVRRNQFLQAARHALSSLPGVEVQSAEVGSLAVVWSQVKNTPLSVESSPNAFSLLLGYALTEAGERLNAGRILELWTTRSQELDTLDGYFLGVASSADGTLSVMCDPLGLFPVYYSVRGDALIVGSSPACCLAHPACSAVLDVRGLAGMLLINGLMEGRTLVQGVIRLKFGHCLEWSQERGVREREIFRLQRVDTWRDLSHEAVLECVEELMRESVQRHCPPGAETALLLSGGLDSRLMAAFLSDEKISYKPFTWGCPYDFEMRAAQAVASKLGLTLAVDECEPSPEAFVDLARLNAQWSAVPGCFGDSGGETGTQGLSVTAPYFWSGFVFDMTLGGLNLYPPAKPEEASESLAGYYFKSINKWGLEPSILKRLLSPVLGAADIDALVTGLKKSYSIPAYTETQNGFLASLLVRSRYHLGFCLHQLSAQSWPLLPFLERRQIQLLFNVEYVHLHDRRLEMDLLQKANSRLMDIPFDTNSFRFSRFLAKKCRRASWDVRMKDRLMSHVRRWYWRTWRREDPRRYYRLYDLNAPPWHVVREAAEACRFRAKEILDLAVLQEILPPCDVPFNHGKPFTKGTSCRNLLGFLFWLEQHPQGNSQKKNNDAH